jgi:hypothetical protein
LRSYVDDSSDSFGKGNKQITDEQSKWILDANQWTYSNLTKQNGYQMPINGLTPISQTKVDIGYQSMDLHQSPKTKQ